MTASANATIVHLIRHPAVLADGHCYGQSDVALAPGALEAALAELAGRLPTNAPVFTSPSLRCLALAQALQPNPTIDPDLTEMDFGHWEGMAWDDVPRDELDAWAAAPLDYAPGGGECGRDVQRRWARFATRLQAHAGPLVVVTHAGVIRMALMAAGRVTEADVLALPVPFGSVHRVALPEPAKE